MLQNQTPKTNSTNTKNLLALQPVELKKRKKRYAMMKMNSNSKLIRIS